MNNIPEVKLGILAVSRDCFPMTLSASRRAKIVETYQAKGGEIFECKTTVENEKDMQKAVAEVKEAGCNALVIFLGNFGPETSETLAAREFGGPVMYIAAAEDSQDSLLDGRGDAYCGVLNLSYNLKLRNIKAYIPENPCLDTEGAAEAIKDFIPIARTILGLHNLKIISFGPRPQDFLACNAPIK